MWLCGLVVAVKFHIRGETVFPMNELSGILPVHKINSMSKAGHSCQYGTTELRNTLKNIFHISPETPVGVATSYSSIMRYMEKMIDVIILEFGGLERVKGTPLPIVYVSHLRLFLLGYLLSLPYIFGHSWGWGTIPAVVVTAYALLGIDGAAVECESPFKQNRPNHLNMELYCLTALKDIEQLVIHNAEINMR